MTYCKRNTPPQWCFLSYCCYLLGCCGIENYNSLGKIEDAHQIVPEDEAQFTLQSAALSIQHPLKHHHSGNCDRYLSTTNILAVADGVNSVLEEGIDGSLFPQDILRRCLELANQRRLSQKTFDQESKKILSRLNVWFNPKEFTKHLIARAAGMTRQLGSTTLCFGLIERGRLQVANIGDSGLLLFRLLLPSGTDNTINSVYIEDRIKNKDNNIIDSMSDDREYCLIGKTYPSCHSFNNPYQITRMPDPILPSSEQIMKDVLIRSSLTTLALQDGDIIIVASDGILDNLHIDQIRDCLNTTCRPTIPTRLSGLSCVPLLHPDTVAQQLVNIALDCAADSTSPTKRPTPFSDGWYAETGKRVTAGKPDDTTVVVAYVEATTSPESHQRITALRLRASQHYHSMHSETSQQNALNNKKTVPKLHTTKKKLKKEYIREHHILKKKNTLIQQNKYDGIYDNTLKNMYHKDVSSSMIFNHSDMFHKNQNELIEQPFIRTDILLPISTGLCPQKEHYLHTISTRSGSSLPTPASHHTRQQHSKHYSLKKSFHSHINHVKSTDTSSLYQPDVIHTVNETKDLHLTHHSSDTDDKTLLTTNNNKCPLTSPNVLDYSHNIETVPTKQLLFSSPNKLEIKKPNHHHSQSIIKPFDRHIKQYNKEYLKKIDCCSAQQIFRKRGSHDRHFYKSIWNTCNGHMSNSTSLNQRSDTSQYTLSSPKHHVFLFPSLTNVVTRLIKQTGFQTSTI